MRRAEGMMAVLEWGVVSKETELELAKELSKWSFIGGLLQLQL